MLVSAEPDVNIGDMWASGKVASEDVAGILYQGKPLASDKTYFWKVRYYDSKGMASEWSAVARFDTGLFHATDWQGHWIGGANQLRKEFTLPEAPARARIFLSGLGYSELRINGRKVGNHVLDPGWTAFEKRDLYVTYDVAPYLRKGANAIAIMLGQGWFKRRAALAQLNVELAGGGTFRLATDTSWQTAPGPILEDSVYDGETYDARRETPGWDRPGYAGDGWKPAVLEQPPGGVLSAQLMPPIEVTDTLVPRKLTSVEPGVYVYDLGQNISGWVQLKVEGPAGTTVRLRHAELIYPNGAINVENLRTARATDVYILKGGGPETYHPRFTYHGFRYVELTGFPGTPTLDTLRAKVVRTAVPTTGGFSCSNDTLNQIQKIAVWGIKTNLHSVPTDCDQRDERKGWMADAHLAAETALFNFDIAPVYRNFLRSIHDEQDAQGAVPDTVPFAGGGRVSDPAWGTAYPLIAWYVYLYTGDRQILEQHYDGLKAWAQNLKSRSQGDIVGAGPYGDWVPIAPTRGDLVSTAYYYYSVETVAKVAEVLGKTADAAAYHQLGDQIKTAFDRRFWDQTNRCYSNDTQTAQALPLFLDMAPQAHAGAAEARMLRDIVYSNNTHLTTGILGIKYMMEVLAEHNPDVAYELASQTTYPSWGYMLERGATTLWELWQEKTGPSMNSHNHPMLGSVGAYFYKHLAGIQPVSSAPGFRRIVMRPTVVRDLEWASGTVDSVRGPITSDWRRNGSGLEWKVVVPFGSEAEIHMPRFNLRNIQITESGQSVWKNDRYQAGVAGITGAAQSGEEIVVTAGSGEYHFSLSGE